MVNKEEQYRFKKLLEELNINDDRNELELAIVEGIEEVDDDVVRHAFLIVIEGMEKGRAGELEDEDYMEV